MQEQAALKEADYTCNAPNCVQMREKLSLPVGLSTVRLLFSDWTFCLLMGGKKRVGFLWLFDSSGTKRTEKAELGPLSGLLSLFKNSSSIV